MSSTRRELDEKRRAKFSEGRSENRLYETVGDFLLQNLAKGAKTIDVGCGVGGLFRYIEAIGGHYVGMDLVRYEGFPAECEFVEADLNAIVWPVLPGSADAVVSIETIEHLENPRAFMRELARIAKPGAWVVVTTPNQLSLLSKLCLLVKNQFDHFQERPGLYPTHITALLESDLLRIAQECRLTEARILYSGHGRMPFTHQHYPPFLSDLFPRTCSDNVALIARKSLG
jgi:2-polyprenyl-3-methyl-5-hydroxy-6-metoxy-1,4-benzoquinol methylase